MFLNNIINSFKAFLKKDIVVKLLLLIMLLLIVYYLFIAGYRADELGTMIRAKLISGGYRPFIDFCESHGQVLRDIIAAMFRLGISSKILVIGIRLTTFILYIIIIYNLIKQFAKKDNLLFATHTKTNFISVLFVSSIMGFIASYSAILTDTLMLLLCPLGLFFLIKGGKRNHIIAGILFGISIISISKSLWIIPLLYIFSLEKNCLKNYKSVLINRLVSGVSILFIIFVYIIVRYGSYTTNELWIIKESLFGVNNYIQPSYNVFKSLITFSHGGINNLCYLLPGIFFMFLSKRKSVVISMVAYMIVQLVLMKYIIHAMPTIIVRYFFPFLIFTPIFFNYEWLNKKSLIKYILIFVIFIIAYIPMFLSNQWNKLLMDNCDQTYRIFNENYTKNIPMFYDAYCFREEFDSDMLLNKFKLDNTLIKTHSFDVDWRLMYNLSFENLQKTPHLKNKFSSNPEDVEVLLRKYDHLYTIFSGCNNIIKIGTYDQMLKDQKYTLPAITCVPFIKKITDLLK